MLRLIILFVQKYKGQGQPEDSNISVPSEPSSPQSSTRSRSNSPDDILERVAADVKEYERENVDTFEASVKAKHNLMTVEQNNGKNLKYRCIKLCVNAQLISRMLQKNHRLVSFYTFIEFSLQCLEKLPFFLSFEMGLL